MADNNINILTPENVRKFLLFKGWINDGNWKKKIEYYVHPKCPLEIRLYVDTTYAKLETKLSKIIANLASWEGIRAEIMMDAFKEFLGKGIQVAESTLTKDQSKAIIKRQLQKSAVIPDPKFPKVDISSDRDARGLFKPGNKANTGCLVGGIGTAQIRKHRTLINKHVEQLIEILLEEAIENRNIQVAQWLVGKIVPDVKTATFANANLVNDVNTLTDLKNQSSETLKESVQGDVSLEEASMLLSVYNEHKALIEAADIEPLAMELAKRTGKHYGSK